METYGWMPLSDTCEYVVTGIDEYPICLQDIPEELFEELRMVAQMQIEDMGAQMVSNYGDQGYQMNHYELHSAYVVSPRENVETDNRNEVYLVYKINASNPDGTRDYFYSAKFSNVTIRADGEYGYDTLSSIPMVTMAGFSTERTFSAPALRGRASLGSKRSRTSTIVIWPIGRIPG